VEIADTNKIKKIAKDSRLVENMTFTFHSLLMLIIFALLAFHGQGTFSQVFIFSQFIYLLFYYFIQESTGFFRL
jgi:hypothetical protein